MKRLDYEGEPPMQKEVQTEIDGFRKRLQTIKTSKEKIELQMDIEAYGKICPLLTPWNDEELTELAIELEKKEV